MTRRPPALRILLFALAFLLVLVALFLARRERSERLAAQMREEARNGVVATPATALETPSGPVDPEASSPTARRRGLWRLPVDEAARLGASTSGHPWDDYIRLREKVLADWAWRQIELDLKGTPVSALPGIVSTATGLVLRIDPAVNGDLTLEFHEGLAADEVLRRTEDRWPFHLRVSVGADGIALLAPPDARSESEPEFILELLMESGGSGPVAGRGPGRNRRGDGRTLGIAKRGMAGEEGVCKRRLGPVVFASAGEIGTRPAALPLRGPRGSSPHRGQIKADSSPESAHRAGGEITSIGWRPCFR